MSDKPERIRTGGRSEKVRIAVGEACLAFLAEGRLDFTTVEVAARAGVSRKTIYRWWPTHNDLLVEAVSMHVRQVAPPDTGAWESDVRAFAESIAEYAAGPVEVASAALMASHRYPDFNQLVLEQYRPVLEAWRTMARRAIERGDANSDHSPEAMVNALAAPLFLAPMMLGRKASAEEIDRIVRMVLAATRPDSSTDSMPTPLPGTSSDTSG
ncbi:TetR family transcriptional regulator [Rhodococcus gordoniae]|uniref:TetR family transcriptional regulator n=1 Tax=Rhodococcus gordoniae TaxID=223392 RepID=A0A379M389_9NOCA|nr:MULTISPECIES: TetR-like C-terminal domain-containing protein [Rhodococcus]SUE16103.1 TetR family transcriptional regulator [Rhodococcus gordoniae]